MRLRCGHGCRPTYSRSSVPRGGRRLEVVLIGDHPASASYVAGKARTAGEIGILANVCRLPEQTSHQELIRRLEFTRMPTARSTGYSLQLPLPRQIAAPARPASHRPGQGRGRLPSGQRRPMVAAGAGEIDQILVPCTPLGCLMLLRPPSGPKGSRGAARSSSAGRISSASRWHVAGRGGLHGHSGAFAYARSRGRMSPRRNSGRRRGGRPELVEQTGWRRCHRHRCRDQSRSGGRRRESRLVGDVAFDEVAAKAGAITPVPGGVGPMTVACLLRNTLTAARSRQGLRFPLHSLRRRPAGRRRPVLQHVTATPDRLDIVLAPVRAFIFFAACK